METRNYEQITSVSDVVEELDVEVLSQEKENMSLNLPESSDGESIHSIILPQRKILINKDNKRKLKEINSRKKTLAKMQKTYFEQTNANVENDIDVIPKKLFKPNPRTKTVFTQSALLNATENKTANVSKSTENPTQGAHGQVCNLFSNQPGKNRREYAEFLLSDSEEESLKIQPRVFEFHKAPDKQQITIQITSPSQSSVRSTASNITDAEVDEWQHLPSSTMVEHQFEEVVEMTPLRRIRMSRISKSRESDIQSNKSNSQIIHPQADEINLSNNHSQKSKNNSNLINKTDDVNKSKRSSSKIIHLEEEEIKLIEIQSQRLNKSKNNDNIMDKKDKINKSKKSNSSIIHPEEEVNLVKNRSQRLNKSKTINNVVVNDNDSINRSKRSNFNLTQLEHEEVILVQNRSQRLNTSKNLDNTMNINEGFNKSKKSNSKTVHSVDKGLISVERINKSKNVNNAMNINDDVDKFEKSNSKIVHSENEEMNLVKNHSERLNNKSTNIYNAMIINDTLNKSKSSNSIITHPEDDIIFLKHHCQRLNKSKDSNNVNDSMNKSRRNNSKILLTNEDINIVKNHFQLLNKSKNNCVVVNNILSLKETSIEKRSDVVQDTTSDRFNAIDQTLTEVNMQEDIIADENDKTLTEDNLERDEDENDEENFTLEYINDEEENFDEVEKDEEHQNISNEENDLDLIDTEKNKNNHELEQKVIGQRYKEKQKSDQSHQPDQSIQENQEEVESEHEMEQKKIVEIDQHSMENEDNSPCNADSHTENDNEKVNDKVNDNVKVNDIEQEQNEIIELDQNKNKEHHYTDENKLGEENDKGSHKLPKDEKENKQIDPPGKSRIIDELKSPEAVRHAEGTQLDLSFTIHGHHTCICESKTVIKELDKRPRISRARKSTGFSDGSLNSSAEGSGWDSHRVTRKTFRQTFGKDITPRKSLRTLVMERAAKRQTNQNGQGNVKSIRKSLKNNSELQTSVRQVVNKCNFQAQMNKPENMISRSDVTNVTQQNNFDEEVSKRKTCFGDITSKVPLANSTRLPGYQYNQEDESEEETERNKVIGLDHEPEQNVEPEKNQEAELELDQEKNQSKNIESLQNEKQNLEIDLDQEEIKKPESDKKTETKLVQDQLDQNDSDHHEIEQSAEVESDEEEKYNEELESDEGREHNEDVDVYQEEEMESNQEADPNKEVDLDPEEMEQTEDTDSDQEEELNEIDESDQEEENAIESLQNESIESDQNDQEQEQIEVSLQYESMESDENDGEQEQSEESDQDKENAEEFMQYESIELDQNDQEQERNKESLQYESMESDENDGEQEQNEESDSEEESLQNQTLESDRNVQEQELNDELDQEEESPEVSLHYESIESAQNAETNESDEGPDDDEIRSDDETEQQESQTFTAANPSQMESSDDEARQERMQALNRLLQRVKEESADERRQMEKKVKKSLNNRPHCAKLPFNPFNVFKIPEIPKPKRSKTTTPQKATKTKTSIFSRELPPEFYEDLKYKPPKRFQGKQAPWITKRLYKFLEDKLRPQYDYNARVRAEKLVEKLYIFVKETRKCVRAAPQEAIDELKYEMARLNIVQTHYQFYQFFHEFIPKEVRTRVNPDIMNKIPKPRFVFGNIIEDQEY